MSTYTYNKNKIKIIPEIIKSGIPTSKIFVPADDLTNSAPAILFGC
jgi:F0F1-type ATP synthase beta subunit